MPCILVACYVKTRVNTILWESQGCSKLKTKKSYKRLVIFFFLTGVSDDVDIEQLYNITRDKDRVSVVDSIASLISDEFVRNFTKKLCNEPGNLGTRHAFLFFKE